MRRQSVLLKRRSPPTKLCGIMPRKVALLNAAAASVVSVLCTEDGGSRSLRNANKFIRGCFHYCINDARSHKHQIYTSLSSIPIQVMWRLGSLKRACGFLRVTNLFMVTDTEKKTMLNRRLFGRQNSG